MFRWNVLILALINAHHEASLPPYKTLWNFWSESHPISSLPILPHPGTEEAQVSAEIGPEPLYPFW